MRRKPSSFSKVAKPKFLRVPLLEDTSRNQVRRRAKHTADIRYYYTDRTPEALQSTNTQ